MIEQIQLRVQWMPKVQLHHYSTLSKLPRQLSQSLLVRVSRHTCCKLVPEFLFQLFSQSQRRLVIHHTVCFKEAQR